LARLLAGHGGTLAWVESVDLVAQEPAAPRAAGQGATPPGASGALVEPAAMASSAAEAAGRDTPEDPTSPQAIARRLAVENIDGYIKVLFDPQGLFPSLPSA